MKEILEWQQLIAACQESFPEMENCAIWKEFNGDDENWTYAHEQVWAERRGLA